jgi:hypothetical protein
VWSCNLSGKEGKEERKEESVSGKEELTSSFSKKIEL